ncbi:hypothetical protein GCM10018965_048090 [Nonomuraea roseola]
MEATSYLLAVSTRRADKPVEQLGIEHISKSQVSEMAKVLDGPAPPGGRRAKSARTSSSTLHCMEMCTWS